MQRDEPMGRAHELHRGPAVVELVAHHLGDGQFGDRLVQCALQTVREWRTGRDGVDEQGLGLAITVATQLLHGLWVQTQRGEFLDQRRRGLARGVQAHRGRHEFLRHGPVGRARQDAGDMHRQPARAGIGRDHRIGRGQALFLQAAGQGVGERRSQRGQGLGRQFFDQEFDEQIVHGVMVGAGAARALHARAADLGAGDVWVGFTRPFSAPVARERRRPRVAAPAGNRGGRGCRGIPAPRRAPGCGCDRCRRRVR